MKNEKVYTKTSHPSILDNDIVVEIPHDKKYKFVQFVVVFHLLSRGQVMINFEGLGDFSNVLKSNAHPRSIGMIPWVGKLLT